MKLIYDTKGQHHEDLLTASMPAHFENGVEATRERLRFYAQHCNGVVELSEHEINSVHVPNVIEVKITKD